MQNYLDDPNIPGSAVLIRRIHPLQFVKVEGTEEKRISSAAFNDTELSVLHEDLMQKRGRVAASALAAHPGYGLATFTASDARSCNPTQNVCYDPIPEEDAHGIVFGKKTNAVKRQLSRIAIIIISV